MSERGVVAVGRLVRDTAGEPLAGLSISMPSVRYDRHRLGEWVTAIGVAVRAIEHDLRLQERVRDHRL
jgi:DNA-binding IclR family transcriptional regulator